MSPLAQNSPLTFRVIQGKSQSLLKLTSQKKTYKPYTIPCLLLFISQKQYLVSCVNISAFFCPQTFVPSLSQQRLPWPAYYIVSLIHISSLLHKYFTPLPCIIFKGTYDSLTYIFTHFILLYWPWNVGSMRAEIFADLFTAVSSAPKTLYGT